jgi:carboxypeptidase C (cathepsin A)
MVFLEQPAGVGFSYDTKASSSSDIQAANDNLLTIRAFYNRFPERRGNTMYLASESYGGHYMPQLTLKVLNDAELNSRFGGFLLGNPYVNWASGDLAMVKTLWGQQLIDYISWYAVNIIKFSSASLHSL